MSLIPQAFHLTFRNAWVSIGKLSYIICRNSYFFILATGDELLIAFDCTQATESIPNWAADNDYPVTRFEQVGPASWEIVVQKR